MKVYLTVLSPQRGFVILPNDWVFIVMDVFDNWNTLYYDEIFLYISGFVKCECKFHCSVSSQRILGFA